MRVAGYVRVSTVEQAVSGLSLSAQTELIESWCKQNNHELVKIYADEGVSASKTLDKRKALLSMLDDAEKGKFDCIAFKDITRWSRSSKYYWIVQDRLDKCKVAWVSIQQPYLGTTDATSRFQTSIMLGTSQLESDQIGERIRFVQDSQVRIGNYPFPSHAAAVGYKTVKDDTGNHLVIDEETAPFVRDMFDTFNRTANASETARILFDRYGKTIHPVNVIRSLKNRIYIGEFRNIPNFIEPLVPLETFITAQNLMKHRNVRKGLHKGEYVFSGLLRCSKCGGKLAGLCMGDKLKYQCKTKGCSNLPIQDKLEQNVLNRIEHLVSDYRFRIDQSKPNRTGEYRTELNRLRQKLSRLTDIYVDGDIDRKEFLHRKADTESRMDELKRLIESESESVPPMLDMDWMEVYHSLPASARNRFWKMCIECIYVDGNEPKEIRFISIADESTRVLAESFAKAVKAEQDN